MIASTPTAGRRRGGRRAVARAVALAGVAALLAGVSGCATFSSRGRAEYQADSGIRPTTQAAAVVPVQQPDGGAGAGSGSGSDQASAQPQASPTAVLPYDVRPLLKPKKHYLGVAVEGAPDSIQPVVDYGNQVGKKPNIIEFYSAWGDPFDGGGAANAWQYGALPFMSWEPKTTTLADIAAGKSDTYIGQVATAIRDANRPVAISFAHEMNGDWGPWGSKNATPAQFVAAWKHIHDLFQTVGATSVIWVWSPNQTNIAHAPLQPYWPGDSYVDWVGVIGYYGQSELHTFGKLFGPTLDEIRAFSGKPILIAETAASPGPGKQNDVNDLYDSVLAADDILGFVWFNFHKNVQGETNWRVDSSQAALDAYQHRAADPRFGFDARKPE